MQPDHTTFYDTHCALRTTFSSDFEIIFEIEIAITCRTVIFADDSGHHMIMVTISSKSFFSYRMWVDMDSHHRILVTLRDKMSRLVIFRKKWT